MKRICLLVLGASLAAGLPLAHAGQQLPAYEALRAVGRDKGDSWLGRLVEVRGADADPQPARWLLTFRDESARGGVREFAVTSQGVVSERTPVRAPEAATATVMSARSLNLDSTGAFAAANKQAAAAKVGFSSLDYTLQNRNGAPIWIVRLFDNSALEVGKVEISAKDGAIVSSLRKLASAPEPGPTPAAGAATASSAQSGASMSDRWVEGGGLVGHTTRFGERTWETTTNTATRIGESISAFFIGRPAPSPSRGN